MGSRVERGQRDRLGEVFHIDRLEAALGGDDRKHWQPGQRREAIGEAILGPEDERRPDNRRLGIRCLDGNLALALGPSINRVRLRVGTNRRNMDKGVGADVAGRLGNILGAAYMSAEQRAVHDPDEVDYGRRSPDRLADRLSVLHVGVD